MYKNQIIAVFGHRGSGKSTWIAENIEDWKPFVLVDPLYDPKFQALNLYKVKSVEEAIEVFRDSDPQRVYISPNLETFDFFCGLVLARRGMTLVVDEVDHYSNSYYLSPYFKKLIKYGRHRETNLVVASRRPKEMNPLLRSQANKFIVFPMGGEDVKELSSYLPKSALFVVMHLKSISNGSEYVEYNFERKDFKICIQRYIPIKKETLDTIQG
jgi:hypothetical protein